jgi:glucan-binding YG repeat protein
MEKLKELVSFLNKSRLKRIEVIGSPPPKRSMSTQFYEGIANNSFENDEDAAKHFFGENASPNDRRYRTLKKRFYDRLVNTIFFIDAAKLDLNKYQNAYYDLTKKVTAGDILYKRGQHKSAIYILKKCLPRVERYEFHELKLRVLKILRVHYGAVDVNVKAYDEYTQNIEHTERALKIEEEAIDLHIRAKLSFAKDRTDFSKHYMTSTEYFKHLSKYLGTKYDSVVFQFNVRSLELMMYSAKRELEKEIITCDKAIESLQTRPYYNPNHIHAFNIEKSAAYLLLSKHEQGIAAAKEAKKYALSPTGQSRSSFFILLNHLHASQYDQAYDVFREVDESNILKKTPQSIREEWRIANGYFYFLVEAGRLDVDEIQGKFRLKKFLNDVPGFAKDKRSTNVPVLVLQVLFFIVRQDFDSSAERLRAVDRYNSRYLLKDNTFRSNCFVKMLLCALDAGFNKIATQRKAKKYLKRLAEMPITQVKQNYETEYIPYEKLWEIVISLLDNSHYLVRR